jgi:hypothetical protein
MMDSILVWNAVALEAVRVSHCAPGKREHNGPTLSSRAPTKTPGKEAAEKVQDDFPGASKKDESGTKESDAFKP